MELKKYANGLKVDSILAWLENQGEYNLTDKVEPKFKVGVWYKCILTPVVHKYFTVGKVYKCELEGCLVDDINEDRVVVLDLECFRPATEDEIPQEKSEAEMVDMEGLGKIWDEKKDLILIRLDRIYDLLLEFKNILTPKDDTPRILEVWPTDPPQTVRPWYKTDEVTCTDTNDNTKKDG